MHAGRGEIPMGRSIPVLPYTHRGKEGLDKEYVVLGHPLARHLVSWLSQRLSLDLQF